MYNQLKLDNQLCFRLYTAARLTMQAYFPYFEPLGITYPQYLVMLVLWEQDHQPVNDIARRLHQETRLREFPYRNDVKSSFNLISS